LATYKKSGSRGSATKDVDSESNPLALVPARQSAGDSTSSSQPMSTGLSTAANNHGTLVSSSLPLSLGNIHGTGNAAAMIPNPSVTLSPAMLSAFFSNQLPQFTANTSQPQVIFYSMPSGVGIPSQNMFTGIQNVQFALMGGFTGVQANGSPSNQASENAGNAPGE